MSIRPIILFFFSYGSTNQVVHYGHIYSLHFTVILPLFSFFFSQRRTLHNYFISYIIFTYVNYGTNIFETPSTSRLQQTHPSIPLLTKLNLQPSQIAKHLHGQVMISLGLV